MTRLARRIPPLLLLAILVSSVISISFVSEASARPRIKTKSPPRTSQRTLPRANTRNDVKTGHSKAPSADGIGSKDGDDNGSRAAASSLKAMSAVRLTKVMQLENFGSHLVKFGMLSGDGSISAIFIQIDSSRLITCITATSLNSGAILWQRGTPNKENFRTSGEIPVQVYDWNQDGYDDVIFYQNDQLIVANGLDGSIQASIAMERPYSLFILKTGQFINSELSRDAGLVVVARDRTELLAPDLSTVWSQSNQFFHFPMAVDVDSDGEDELLAGYLLFKSNGNLVWDRRDLGAHNDSADFADVNCDGVTDIAVATSGRAALLSSTGESIWSGKEFHSQHITTGNFLTNTCERQIATIDRDQKQSGILRLYSPRGRLIWEIPNLGNRVMMSRVDNWIPEVKESLILLSRSLNGAPRLLDGKGKVVATLPFPPAIKFDGKKRYYAHHFVQHFDMDNDGREEMLVYNEDQLWIYANRAPIVAAQIEQPKPSQSLPSPRIYNSTFYTGMQ